MDLPLSPGWDSALVHKQLITACVQVINLNGGLLFILNVFTPFTWLGFSLSSQAVDHCLCSGNKSEQLMVAFVSTVNNAILKDACYAHVRVAFGTHSDHCCSATA